MYVLLQWKIKLLSHQQIINKFNLTLFIFYICAMELIKIVFGFGLILYKKYHDS